MKNIILILSLTLPVMAFAEESQEPSQVNYSRCLTAMGNIDSFGPMEKFEGIEFYGAGSMGAFLGVLVDAANKNGKTATVTSHFDSFRGMHVYTVCGKFQPAELKEFMEKASKEASKE